MEAETIEAAHHENRGRRPGIALARGWNHLRREGHVDQRVVKLAKRSVNALVVALHEQAERNRRSRHYGGHPAARAELEDERDHQNERGEGEAEAVQSELSQPPPLFAADL